MTLTGQLGTPPSELNNIELAFGAGLPSPGLPTYAGEIETGPPIQGAPWFKRQILVGVTLPQIAPVGSLAGPPPFLPEVREGPPMRGAPWVLPHWIERLDLQLSAAQILANQPPQSSPGEIQTGPPIQGAPWFKRQAQYPVVPLSQPVQPALPVGQSTPVPEIHSGPPLRGAPWLQQLPIAELPTTNGPPTPILRRPSHNAPFLVRVQGPDEKDNWRRLDRFTERAASLINSLVYQGIIKQTGPATFTIMLPSGGGSGMGGGGATGTFTSGSF